MSIRFACKCGKHLRAGDTMAGRHTLCPKCGALVAIPTAEQAAAGAALPRAVPSANDTASKTPDTSSADHDDAEEIGPVLVRVRRRNDADPNQFRKSIWMPLDPERGPPVEKMPKPKRVSARRRYVWQLEKHWYQSLGYPFRAWQALTALGLAQAAFLVWTANLIPRINGAGQPAPGIEIAVFSLTALLLGGYTVGLLDCVLSSAGAGEYRVVRFPGKDLGMVASASVALCFLAGPIIPALVALWYWHDCGDPDLVDWIILSELAGVTLAYWLVEILAARESGGWIASPDAVVERLARMGARWLLVAAGPALLGYISVKQFLGGMAHWHASGLLGLPRLLTATVFCLFAAVFLLRVIGVWSYRSRTPQGEGESASETEPKPAAGSKGEEKSKTV
jgi:hypothetical protein